MIFAILSFIGGEMFVVLLAVLVLFGADKIPEFARTLGKMMNEFRKATDDLKKEFREGVQDFTEDLKESQKEIDEHVKEIKGNLSEPVGYEPYENLDKENGEPEEKKYIDSSDKQHLDIESTNKKEIKREE